VTAWIDEELLEDDRMVSASFKLNKLLMEKLAAKKPQIMEPVRSEVNVYNNFVLFY
jgi:hypothetical protein